MSPMVRLDDYIDREGNIAIPAGVTLTAFLDRNVEELGDTPAYRYLDFDRDRTVELSWNELRTRLRAVGARLQQVTEPGDRVADPRAPGRRLRRRVLRGDPGGHHRGPAVRPRTTRPRRPPRGGARRRRADGGPDHDGGRRSPSGSSCASCRATAGPGSSPSTRCPTASVRGSSRAPLRTDDVAYLQYTSGSTRTPAGVEITHRSACTNVVQMVDSGRPGPEHPQRQLASAVPRHGPADDHVPGAVRWAHHADVAGVVRATPVPVDQGARRVRRPHLRRGTELRVRAGRPARSAAGGRHARPQQRRGSDQRVRAGQRRLDRQVPRRVRALRPVRRRGQTVLRDGRGHAVRVHHRSRRATRADLPGSRRTRPGPRGARRCRPSERAWRRCRAAPSPAASGP